MPAKQTYRASSLDDIARMFDQRAAVARDHQARAQSSTYRTMHRSEANTWESAAAILRSTIIEPAKEV